jgi:hypothetical protein
VDCYGGSEDRDDFAWQDEHQDDEHDEDERREMSTEKTKLSLNQVLVAMIPTRMILPMTTLRI